MASDQWPITVRIRTRRWPAYAGMIHNPGQGEVCKGRNPTGIIDGSGVRALDRRFPMNGNSWNHQQLSWSDRSMLTDEVPWLVAVRTLLSNLGCRRASPWGVLQANGEKGRHKSFYAPSMVCRANERAKTLPFEPSLSVSTLREL